MKTRTSFSIFMAVVNALFLREIQTRFGAQKLGYLWALIDALTQIVVFSIIKVLLMSKAMPQIDYPVFLAIGFLAYNFFRYTVIRAMDAFDANQALFSYRQVKPIDTILSRFMVEFLILATATSFLILVGLYLDFDITVKDFNMVIFAFIWIGLFGFGLGILFGVIGFFFENFKRIVKLLFVPMFFLSALFYTVDSLPPVAREYILYNPVVHFMEMIHGNYFLVLDDRYVDYTFMLYWTMIPLFLGLWGYKKTEKKIIAS